MLTGVLALLASCASTGSRYSARTLDGIEAELRTHIEILASDEYGGRRPGSDGERKTLQYLAERWEAAGLVSATNDPANPWLAPIELAVRRPVRGSIFISRDGEILSLPEGGISVFASGRGAILADAPLLYVGQLGEELSSEQLTGKVAVMMWDHPGREDQRAALLEKGAAAVLALVVSKTEYGRLVRLRKAGTYRLAEEEAPATIDGYMSLAAASQLFGADRVIELVRMAEAGGFTPVPLDLTASIEASSLGGALRTHNLIARLPGSNPDAGAVLLMAHWDHFGLCGDPAGGDAVCNGAVDNASGLAVLTELAERLASGKQMERDVYFLATTAEEWGLLGAKAFVRDPPLPLDSIVAAFNLDTVAVAPRGSEVALVGRGLTAIEEDVSGVVARSGRRLASGNFADRFLRRQDGWVLLQADVPVLMVSSAFGNEDAFRRYDETRYHRAADNPSDIELGGAAEDMALHLDLVRHFASPRAYPGS